MKKELHYFNKTPFIIGIMLFLIMEFTLKQEAFSQDINDISIRGTITGEEEKTTLPGVNVMVKGTTLGTVTDIDGNYSLNVPDENTTLVFSYIGYISQEALVGGRTVIDITLSTDIQSLREVVVVGYGIRKTSLLLQENQKKSIFDKMKEFF